MSRATPEYQHCVLVYKYMLERSAERSVAWLESVGFEIDFLKSNNYNDKVEVYQGRKRQIADNNHLTPNKITEIMNVMYACGWVKSLRENLHVLICAPNDADYMSYRNRSLDAKARGKSRTVLEFEDHVAGLHRRLDNFFIRIEEIEKRLTNLEKR